MTSFIVQTNTLGFILEKNGIVLKSKKNIHNKGGIMGTTILKKGNKKNRLPKTIIAITPEGIVIRLEKVSKKEIEKKRSKAYEYLFK